MNINNNFAILETLEILGLNQYAFEYEFIQKSELCGIEIIRQGNNIKIIYSEKAFLFRALGLLKERVEEQNFNLKENANFTMKTKFATLRGVVEKAKDGIFVFNFKAFGGMNIGKLDVYTTLSGKTLSLTCDVKKIVELSKKIISITNNSTLKSVVKLLDSYDGVTAGFKLKKQ